MESERAATAHESDALRRAPAAVKAASEQVEADLRGECARRTAAVEEAAAAVDPPRADSAAALREAEHARRRQAAAAELATAGQVLSEAEQRRRIATRMRADEVAAADANA